MDISPYSMDSNTWLNLKTRLKKLQRKNRKELSKHIDIHDEGWISHTNKVIKINKKIFDLEKQLSRVTVLTNPS